MFKLRPATIDDADTLLAFKNDPQVLLNSYYIRKPVARADFLKWYKVRLADPLTALFVFERDGVSIGDVRLDLGKEVEISIRLDPLYRGKGCGTWAIAKATHIAWKHGQPIAYIVDGNIASFRLFLKNGYKMVSYKSAPPIGLYKLVCQK